VWCGAIGGGQVLNTVLKTLVARSRPVFEHPIVIDDGYGFPSGHSMLSVVAYGLLAYLIYQTLTVRWQQVSLIVLTTFSVLLIGLSRIILGVHFTSDVLAGYTIGIIWLSITVVVLQVLNQLSVERIIHLSVQRTVAVE
jgi:undecaprenyl-diphosphatase